jgi:hypothetical protein
VSDDTKIVFEIRETVGTPQQSSVPPSQIAPPSALSPVPTSAPLDIAAFIRSMDDAKAARNKLAEEARAREFAARDALNPPEYSPAIEGVIVPPNQNQSPENLALYRPTLPPQHPPNAGSSGSGSANNPPNQPPGGPPNIPPQPPGGPQNPSNNLPAVIPPPNIVPHVTHIGGSGGNIPPQGPGGGGGQGFGGIGGLAAGLAGLVIPVIDLVRVTELAVDALEALPRAAIAAAYSLDQISPQVVLAETLGELQHLQVLMERSGRIGDESAGFITSENNRNAALDRLTTELSKDILPALTALNDLITPLVDALTATVQTYTDLMDPIIEFFESPDMLLGGIEDALGIVASEARRGNDIRERETNQTDIKKTIADFLDPGKQALRLAMLNSGNKGANKGQPRRRRGAR